LSGCIIIKIPANSIITKTINAVVSIFTSLSSYYFAFVNLTQVILSTRF
jgi:hypothetical protein